MIQQATYTSNGRTAMIRVERIDTWVESTATVINFPGLVELDGDRLYMTVHRARHGAPEGEPISSLVSEDAGATWKAAPSDSPFIARHAATGRNYLDFGSGTLGYLRDGTIGRIDTYPLEIVERSADYDRSQGPFHAVMQMDEATFRWRRWTRNGEPLEVSTFQVEGLPWTTSSYENYGSVVELDDGDLLAPILRVFMDPARPDHTAAVFIARSPDRGKSWQLVTVFDPREFEQSYGIADRPVEAGFSEPELALLANGDLLCIMRSGSYSPMFQARSTDGGNTWSAPVNTGWPGVKPQLDVLPNGVLACTTGRGGYGHPQVTGVILSLDGTGEHWELPFNFHTGPGCSYTSTMQRDGKLHVVYSHSDFTREMGTHDLPSQTIRRAVIDVQVSS